MSVDIDLPQTHEELIASGWDAISRGAWNDAHATFTNAVARDPSAEALEGLGMAAGWTNALDQVFTSRTEAFRRYNERGDLLGAGRIATILAIEHCVRRGETAIANGWTQRAYRLLDGLEATPEYVMLLAWDAHMAVWSERDTIKARRLASRAARDARALGVLDLEMLAQGCDGYARVLEGDIDDGMRLLDEAASVVVSGEMTDLDAMSTICCYLISACEHIRDYGRAAEWCTHVRTLSEQWSYIAMFAYCRTHYAEVLISRGRWAEAERQLVLAMGELETTLPALAAGGVARLVDLRRRQGRLDDAEELIQRLKHEPLAMVGSIPALLRHAEIALDRGDLTTAVDFAERYLRANCDSDVMERIEGLALLVQIHVTAGNPEAAKAPVRELERITQKVQLPWLRALIKYCDGLIFTAHGELDDARRAFEDAVDLYERAAAPYDVARARLELAQVLTALGRKEQAAREGHAAHEALERIGAYRDAKRAAQLLADLKGSSDQQPSARHGIVRLTPRETEVLRWVARGLGDKEIAATLNLSEHTVHRHVSNILTKTSAPTRAAAVAYAAEHELL